jgi:hypothetical protein
VSSVTRVTPLSLHPGGIASNLQLHVDPEMKEAWRKDPLLKNAATSVYVAVSTEWEGRGGKYLSDCLEQGRVKADHPPLASR